MKANVSTISKGSSSGNLNYDKKVKEYKQTLNKEMAALIKEEKDKEKESQKKYEEEKRKGNQSYLESKRIKTREYRLKKKFEGKIHPDK